MNICHKPRSSLQSMESFASRAAPSALNPRYKSKGNGRRQCLTNLPSEIRRTTCHFGKVLAGLRTYRRFQDNLVYLLTHASQSLRGPVRKLGFRFCLPLRGSPGFSPDSLLSIHWHVNAPTPKLEYKLHLRRSNSDQRYLQKISLKIFALN